MSEKDDSKRNGNGRNGQPRRKALDLRLALNALSDVVQNRPPPIREFDQIYMKVGDMVVYAEYLCRKLDGRSLVFVGDGDAIGLSIAHLMNEGILDYGPSRIILLDFDERMVNSVNRFAQGNDFADRMEARLYNVADEIDPPLLESFEAFHINPPWGQYNDGKSVISFLRRGAQLLTDDGLGVVAIADDETKKWPGQVLRMTQKAAIDLGMAVVEMQPHMHTYHLEDAPELASCAMIFRKVEKFELKNEPLTTEEKKDFYGRDQHLEARFVREIAHIGRGMADPRDYKIESEVLE
ncbi:bis-aminopropyl spermidine synthase family protein [Rhizobium sp. DKSPLA3]|uniref:Bis-aminopropyl spermidine synthase family protein n=1 Tax=Rhizobium quercicola TaxID=2901226 RepID=A0A9X1T2D8_9HYPH|nr:bis-aminopropyl spermidine synthase family protein [Rhizobium quercicola]MCD7111671.1 bis-aminopropyl spermidine synthase family protein [Rhizobium quercicola]